MATGTASKKPNTGGGSRAYVERVQGLRSSGAAGKHQSKADRRARTRSQALQRAIHRDRAAG
jgi:hypothetical protein